MSYIHQKSKSIKYPFTTRIILKVARQMGLDTEVIDKKFGYFFMIRKDRREEYFINNILPLNSMVAHRIARDKVYTYMVLEKNGINIPDGNYFFSENFRSNYTIVKSHGRQEAIACAAKLGYPVVVKINDLSMGQEVYLVKNLNELKKRLSYFFKKDYIAIIQKPVAGREFRLAVLDGKIHIAYEKISRRFCKNMSLGARAVDATRNVHPFYQQLTRKIFNLLNLRVGGIDIIVDDIIKPDKNYCILEVNSMMSLEHFYDHGGQKRVEEFYQQVLKVLFGNQ